MTPEQKYKKKVREHLTANGWDVVMVENAIGRGTPDMNVSHPLYGEFWIEAKFGDKAPKVRPEQNAWMTRSAMRGRKCLVVWSYPDSGWTFWTRAYTRTGNQWCSHTEDLHKLLTEHLHAFSSSI